MKKKMLGLFVTLILASMALAACGGAASTEAPPVLEAPAVAETTPDVVTDSYPTGEAVIHDGGQTVSGILVVVESVRLEGKTVSADVCFTMPTEENWTVHDATISYDDQVIPFVGSLMLRIEEPANGLTGARCDTLDFVATPEVSGKEVTLTINSLIVSPGPEACEVYAPKIEATLYSRGHQIDLGCANTDGWHTMYIAGKPETMSEDHAWELVNADEHYTMSGPWGVTFTAP